MTDHVLQSIAWVVIILASCSLIATFVDSWSRLDADVSAFEERNLMGLPKERYLEAASLLDAACDIAEKALGDDAALVHLSVSFHHEWWSLFADFDVTRGPWWADSKSREELLKGWAADVGWVRRCIEKSRERAEKKGGA